MSSCEEECAVCLEAIDLSINQTLTTTDCGHTFHSGCLDKWMSIQNSCPSCRKDEPEESPTEEDIETSSQKRLRECSESIEKIRKFIWEVGGWVCIMSFAWVMLTPN